MIVVGAHKSNKALSLKTGFGAHESNKALETCAPFFCGFIVLWNGVELHFFFFSRTYFYYVFLEHSKVSLAIVDIE